MSLDDRLFKVYEAIEKKIGMKKLLFFQAQFSSKWKLPSFNLI